VTGGKPNEENLKEKYNSVNIGDEETQNEEENQRLKKEIEKERKLAFNACSILKIEEEYIGNFFFGKKVNKKEKEKKNKNTFSDEEINEEADDEEEEENEGDYTLSKFYQSNTREELQNQLKDLNFEEEEEEVVRKSSEDEMKMNVEEQELLSGSDEEEKEFVVESGGRGESKEEGEEGKDLGNWKMKTRQWI
jgi:hypothetical protein